MYIYIYIYIYCGGGFLVLSSLVRSLVRSLVCRVVRQWRLRHVARCLKAAARNRRPVVEAAEDDADDGLDDVAAEVLADVADALLPRAPPPRGGETTCCTPAPKPPDPEAGVELPTLSPLHDALREA